MAIKYNAAGKIIGHKFTIRQLERADQEGNGFCRACGAEAYGVEPDARRYECETCGKNQVYGAGELAIMGLVKGSTKCA